MKDVMKHGGMFLGWLVGLAAVHPAYGVVVAPPPPIADRVARADCIVVAKVVALESQRLTAAPQRNSSEKVEYAIAVLKVSESIKGAKQQKTVRLGFPAPAERKGVVRPSAPRFGPTFKVGQEGLFFLSRHFQEPMYLAPTYFAFISEENLNYRQEVALSRFVQKVGNKLAAGLDSEHPQERYYAAALLIQQYRAGRGKVAKTELVEAKESQLILTTLAEADWKQPGAMTPWKVFNQLGLTAKDGWNSPSAARSAEEQQQAARAWLRKNAATYRIVRIVVAPAGPRSP